VTILGARPQFIKAAPLSRALNATGDIQEILVHTGQHYDFNMSQIFFEELGIPEPHHHLEIRAASHGAMTGRMLEQIEQVLLDTDPNVVVVYGDTNSTLAGALAAAKLHVPVAHVEAGLRSFNRRMPEEINRVLTDDSSDLLLCPTKTAVENLAREGVTKGVHWTGDIMYDAVLVTRARAEQCSNVLEENGLVVGNYALATVHRAENTDTPEKLAAVIGYLDAQADHRPVVLPLHPRTRAAAQRCGLDFGRITLLDPVGFFDMAALLSHCTKVYTDSGGVQKEAYFHGKPCVTLRSETEWTETVEHGWNRLWTQSDYAPRRPIQEYGDGQAASRIVDLLRETFGSKST
jgi:UDP-GlcNAc3NAcA epimerase